MAWLIGAFATFVVAAASGVGWHDGTLAGLIIAGGYLSTLAAWVWWRHKAHKASIHTPTTT